MSRSLAAKRHNAIRGEVTETILELLAEGAIGPKRLGEEVLKRVPDATLNDVGAVRTILRAKTNQIEMRGNKLCLTGVDSTKPITKLEKEVVAFLVTRKTAKQVTEGCDYIRDDFTARSVLQALARREIISELPNTNPVAFLANPEQLVEEGAA